jgi:hypothetical protein
MTQRAAVLIDGRDMDALRGHGWELDYARVLKAAGRGNPGRADGGFLRNVVIAQVYLEARDAPGAGWQRFLSFLRGQGYATSLCDNGAVHVQIVHDLLVCTLTGRIDAAILVLGSGAAINGGFEEAIQTVKAHAVHIETWALDTVPESVKGTTDFRDLKQTTLLRRARRP